MKAKPDKDLKKAEEQQKRLVEETVKAITASQNDIQHTRMLGPKYMWESTSDEIFDVVEKTLVDTARKGKPLPYDDRAYKVICDMAAEGVDFLEKIACARLKLDSFLKEKCARLVNGAADQRHGGKDRRKASSIP